MTPSSQLSPFTKQILSWRERTASERAVGVSEIWRTCLILFIRFLSMYALNGSMLSEMYIQGGRTMWLVSLKAFCNFCKSSSALAHIHTHTHTVQQIMIIVNEHVYLCVFPQIIQFVAKIIKGLNPERWCLALYIMTSALCAERGSCCCALKHSERGKASLNVGCCVIPPRAPLLFLCLGPHVTVGYFLWWLARINRSSNVHPVSQQLHDWWDFTSLIYFIIVTRTWGEWRNGVHGMRNVTCDRRYGTGTIQMPGLCEDYIWCLNVSCCMSRGVFPIRPCALCHSAPGESSRLIVHAMCCAAPGEPQRVFTIQPLGSRSSPYDIYGFVVSGRLHACSL